jgi:hypothetical protein
LLEIKQHGHGVHGLKEEQLGLDQLIFLANIAGVTQDTTRLLVFWINSSDQLEIDMEQLMYLD